MDEEIMRIQCEEGDKQMDLLRAAVSCIRAAEKKRPEAPTARHDGLNRIYKFLQVRHGAMCERLGQINARVQRLTAPRLNAFGSGEMTL